MRKASTLWTLYVSSDDSKLLVASSVSLPSWLSSLAFHFVLIKSMCGGLLSTSPYWSLYLYSLISSDIEVNRGPTTGNMNVKVMHINIKGLKGKIYSLFKKANNMMLLQ